MREHIGLYRGKRVDNGEWVHGCLLYDREQNEAFIAESFEDRAANIREVDPDTVGEATGRKFKDKMCFEGDIIFARHSRLLVGWDYDYSAWLTYYFDDMGNPRRFCPLHDIALWETDGIIGNVHDNPELLERR